MEMQTLRFFSLIKKFTKVVYFFIDYSLDAQWLGGIKFRPHTSDD